MKFSGHLWESKVGKSRRKNAYSLDKVQQTLGNTGYFRRIMDGDLAEVGQNLS